MAHGATLLPLGAVGRDDVSVAGGKGANLGELVRAGFPVPAGFVVTTEAYRQVTARLELHGRRSSGDPAALRDAVSSAAVPAGLRSAIEAAYRQLGGGPVAVRSSATAEDLPGAAFAGQQDTFLGISGADAVIDAVRRCWASLWTDRAIAYRERIGIAPSDVSIAVVVQSLVDADVAGVLFTANPVTGDRSQTIIDASPGLGESVVSGLVTPDHVVVAGNGEILTWTAGRREVVVRPAANGVRREEGTASGTPVLDTTQVAALVHLGARVEALFGRPQDIEWALADGAAFLLQARAMTALPPPPVALHPLQRRAAAVLLDYLPVRPYPLDITTWWRFGPAGLMIAVARGVGISIDPAAVLPEVGGVVDRFAPPLPRLRAKLLTTPFRLLWRAGRFDPARWKEDERYARFDESVRMLRAAKPERLRWAALLGVVHAVAAAIGPITGLRSAYLPGAGLALGRLLALLTVLRRRQLMGDLLVGARTRTTDGNDALDRLAQIVQQNPSLRELFATTDAADLEEAVTSRADAAGFLAEFAAFLDEFGHRETVSPVLASSPTWSERPVVPLGLIALLAAESDRQGDESRADPAGAAEVALFRHPLLTLPARRRVVRRLLERAREGIRFREDSHFEFMRLLPPLRSALLEMGGRLSAAGILSTADDVFHLRLEELEAIADPARIPAQQAGRLKAVVRSRAARREELASVKLIDLSQIFPAPAGGALVQGSPASGGVATGVVRVILDAVDFGTLRPGEILVCGYTNPSWTPLFSRAAAVVVDSGGIGSHAAVVAREHGLPAVMGTGSATTVLTTGQRVTVDGNTGRVLAANGNGRPPKQD